MDYQGHIQAGGTATGAPWAEGVCTLTDTEVILTVNAVEVGRYPRSSITFTRQDSVYSLEGAGEPLFFLPLDDVAFAAAVGPTLTAAERIAQATGQAGTPAPSTPAPQSPDQKPIWQRWWFIAAAVIVIIALAASLGGNDPEVIEGATTTTTAVPSSTTAQESTTTAPVDTTTSEPASTTTTTEASTTTGPTTTTVPEREIAFGDGVQIVGEDVQPGIYETGIVDELFGCYWERLAGLSGDFEEILANNNVAGHDVVEIMPADVAFDSDCGGWYSMTPLDQPLSTIPVGKWMIGAHISPGTYEAPGSDVCYWERLSGVSGDLDDVIANDLPSGRAIVEIASSDFAFNSNGCGEWTLRP